MRRVDEGPVEFAAPPELTAPRVAAGLGAAGEVQAEPPREIQRRLLDTFDRRVAAAGGALEEVTDGSGPRLEWRRLADGELLGRVPGSAPRFGRDLPPGPGAARLAALLEVRALLPLVTLSTRSEPLEVRNRDGKVVVRAYLEAHWAHGPGAPDPVELGTRVRLAPVRGYPKALRRAREALGEGLGLAPAPQPLGEAAFAAVGAPPAAPVGKPGAGLTPDEPAGQAVRAVLRELLDTIEANRPGAQDAVDPEFLHDLRVAVRRTRALLGRLEGVFSPGSLAPFREGFAWLGAVTGLARDYDVYLEELPGYLKGVPAEARRDLAPLRARLERTRRGAQRALVRALNSRRYQRLVASWREFLARETSAQDAPTDAAQPVAAVAGAAVAKALKRVLREGRAVDDASPPEALHDLRKSCKKLRYLLELFQGAFSGDEARRTIQALKGLQDNLGVFQDLEVHAQALDGLRRELGAETPNLRATDLAFGMLAQSLAERQRRVRGEFGPRFAAFAKQGTRRLRRLAPASGAGEEGS